MSIDTEIGIVYFVSSYKNPLYLYATSKNGKWSIGYSIEFVNGVPIKFDDSWISDQFDEWEWVVTPTDEQTANMIKMMCL